MGRIPDSLSDYYRRKYRSFLGSAFALRRCSDILCAEHSLSVIANPQPSPGKDYAKYMYGSERPPTFSDALRRAIDEALAKAPASFDTFLELLRDAGITVKRRGNNISLLAPGQKRATRLDSLKGDYTDLAIRKRLRSQSGVRS